MKRLNKKIVCILYSIVLIGINVFGFAISMAGFVLGVTFVFAIIEDVGYMARISVVFNSAM